LTLRLVALCAAGLLLGGCASVPLQPGPRAFDPQRDSFAFSNDIIWQLPTQIAQNGGLPPAPGRADYHQHCVVVARSSRQFFVHARFDALQPPVDDDAYRKLVREVVSRNPRGDLDDPRPVVIPGYADLRTFSRDHEMLLKDEMGSVLQTYFQRGNWRITLPFTRAHQKRVSLHVLRMLEARRPVVIHVVKDFPFVSINHAVLVYGATETPTAVRFDMYDPNNPNVRYELVYDRETRTFLYPATDYFRGGPVNAYEIYRRGLF
jgi:hypothetical protein